MLHSYKSFLMITEGREEKLEKQRIKIHKFLKFEPIIDYVFDKVVDKNGTRGLKYTIWFCDRIKQVFIERMMKNFVNITNFLKTDEQKRKFFKYYLETGKFDTSEWINADGRSVEMSDNEKIDLKKRISDSFTWMPLDNWVPVIVDWLKSPIRDEEVNLSEYTLQEALEKSKKWHDELKDTGIILHETGTILMTFDDGYYWIDLETTSSREEADAMGHCGTTNYGKTLYSLRKKQSPHVTSAIGGEYDTIYQMKGRNNERPIEKYHKYIFELLSYPNVSENVKIESEFDKITIFSTTEWEPGKDFHVSDFNVDLIIKLKERNPELISNLGFPVKYKLYKGGVITKEELVKDFNDLKIVGDEIHFILKDWTDFDKSIFKTDRGYIDGWQLDVLEGTYLDSLSYNDFNFDYDYVYDKIKPYVFNDIMELVSKKGYVINYSVEDNDEKELILSSENMSLNEKQNDIIVKTPEGVIINFEDLLSPGSKSDVSAYSNDLEGLKDVFDSSYSMAQSLADEGEAWEAVTNAIQNKIGPLIKKDGTWWFEDGLHFKLNFDYISDIINAGEDIDYKSILDIINNIPSESDDDLLIDVDVPYYGWQGTIDADTLSEEIINRLDEV